MSNDEEKREAGRGRRRASGGAEAGARGDAVWTPHIPRVIKRDGREVPFEAKKISDAVSAAIGATGEESRGAAREGFADEVASVVELALADRLERERVQSGAEQARAPHIETIQDLVEHGLMELGCPAVAKAYILYRDRRARVREALSVHEAPLGRVTPASLRVREAEGTSRWSKGRIVAALMDEAELSRSQSEEVAAAVEKRVFASGLRRISTALVRELVAGELVDRGYMRALARQSLHGLARTDLLRLFQDTPLRSWDRRSRPAHLNAIEPREGATEPLPERVGSEVLARFGLEDILSEGVAELHRAGDLHVEALGRADRPLTVAVELELVAPAAAGRAFHLLGPLGELARDVGERLVLERPAAVLSGLVRSTRPGAAHGLGGWLASLEGIGSAAGIRIEIGSPGARAIALTARLVEELGELTPSPHGPALWLEGHEFEALLEREPRLERLLDRLLSEGRLVPSWGERDEQCVGPGCHRLYGERGAIACAGAVALNLPRLARRAGPWREDLVLAGVADLVQAANEAIADLERHQKGLRPERPRGLRTRRSYALVPVGLREALRHLGDGEIDTDQGARIFGLLREAAGRFATTSAAVVAPCPFFGATAARRFAILDARLRSRAPRQRALFADALDEEAPQPYTQGFLLQPVGRHVAGRSEAECLRTLVAGALPLASALQPSPELRPLAGDDLPWLSAWRRFEVLRRAHTGELSLELFSNPSARHGDDRGARPSDDASTEDTEGEGSPEAPDRPLRPLV